jgi:peptidoglycan/LPS O-acetylase OafA/YrhL
LWSLAVEQQFYIAWPVVLWLALRLRLNMLAVIFILAVGSFAPDRYAQAFSRWLTSR